MLSRPEKLSCSIADDLQVMLTAEAFQQLSGYAYATRSEISCLGVVKKKGNLFVVERFYLVTQKGSSSHTEMAPEAIAELMEELLAKGKADEAKALKCWAHSHPSMRVFWSKTDDETCQRLASDCLVSLVVSEGFAIRCWIDIGTPFPFSVDNVPVVFEAKVDETRLTAYRKEVEEKIAHESRSSFGPGFPEGELFPAAHTTDAAYLCELCRDWHPPGRCQERARTRPLWDELDEWYEAQERELDPPSPSDPEDDPNLWED